MIGEGTSQLARRLSSSRHPLLSDLRKPGPMPKPIRAKLPFSFCYL